MERGSIYREAIYYMLTLVKKSSVGLIPSKIT